MFDINRAFEQTEPVQYPANFRQVAAELDDSGAIVTGEPGCYPVLLERRRDHRKRVVARDQRDPRCGRDGGQG